jgi:prophage regulatory protein
MHTSSLLRLPDVVGRTGLPRSSLYQKVKRGQFPAPVKLGERAVAWHSAQIDTWIASRIGASVVPPALPADKAKELQHAPL